MVEKKKGIRIPDKEEMFNDRLRLALKDVRRIKKKPKQY